MESDYFESKRRARRAYEWGRARRALAGFVPSLGIVGVAALLGTRPLPTLTFGGLMFVWGALLLWYGRDLRRAVLPGLVAGMVPLALTLCAKHFGHACAGTGCLSLCIPACVVGGITAGVVVAAVGHQRRHGLRFWLSASAIALLTGAMGCVCVGSAGLVGLLLGYCTGAIPGAALALFARRAA